MLILVELMTITVYISFHNIRLVGTPIMSFVVAQQCCFIWTVFVLHSYNAKMKFKNE